MSENGVKLDPRVRRTRQLLQEALIELIEEKSMESVTVQDIAARAGVNRATFYAHFEDKNALLNYMVRDKFQARLDQRLPSAPQLTTDNLHLLIGVTCEYIAEFIGHCAPVRQATEHAIMFLPVQHHLHETLLDWLRRAEASSPEIVAVSLSWTIWGTALQWAREGRKIPLARLTEQLLLLVQGALHSHISEGVRV